MGKKFITSLNNSHICLYKKSLFAQVKGRVPPIYFCLKKIGRFFINYFIKLSKQPKNSITRKTQLNDSLRLCWGAKKPEAWIWVAALSNAKSALTFGIHLSCDIVNNCYKVSKINFLLRNYNKNKSKSNYIDI